MPVNMLAPPALQQTNRSDYLSVGSVGYTIDVELHCNLLLVWCIDQAVGIFLVCFWFNMGLLGKTSKKRKIYS